MSEVENKKRKLDASSETQNSDSESEEYKYTDEEEQLFTKLQTRDPDYSRDVFKHMLDCMKSADARIKKTADELSLLQQKRKEIDNEIMFLEHKMKRQRKNKNMDHERLVLQVSKDEKTGEIIRTSKRVRCDKHGIIKQTVDGKMVEVEDKELEACK